ncbi:branched-chain amino acid ABC transporter permease [Nocardia aurantia]|uniref:Branched-chain amino acid ABC transporter permease n=1 Tax=Nocardia aurantia TaxID=2585199 RepID=A0A7K0DVJ4_9NOCA|nr:branched-chain amino acid ABC transporter permease [Nocardia aurantia]MQY29801.1 hypothetical protein [Nocardia aurantia]
MKRIRFSRFGLPPRLGYGLIFGGAGVALGSTFTAWTWTRRFPGNLTVTGYPGGNQLITLAAALVVLIFALGAIGVPVLRALAPRGFERPLRALTLALAASTWYTLLAIAVELGGLANWEPGAAVAGIGTLLTVAGAFGLPTEQRTTTAARQPNSDTARSRTSAAPRQRAEAALGRPAAAESRQETEAGPVRQISALPWRRTVIIELATVFGVVLVAMVLFDYGLDTDSTEAFLAYALAVGFAGWALVRAGLTERFSALTARHRRATGLATVVAAVVFVVLQNDDTYTTTADNILVFGTAALGLNIVVGLTGLLDLGYVAFLGVGAYTAALVSGSAFSRFAHVTLPFWGAALLGTVVAVIFGVLIGAPTLRLRGDYLAIVTLGFGEIFRITVNNLNGVSGPDLTNGPNGIPAIPDLDLFGWDFGKSHHVLGITLTRFGNYYLLLVALIAVVALIYAHVRNSRIGRAWVAIREDEMAAAAMGINGFRLKLLAFGLGASLAGLAGTIQAHVTTTATPDQYQFAGTAPPNSAFLLAAVVLGGMGTISGPLLGAAVLYLVPEKLQFFENKQLLLFAITLILMMRFRPEGLVPDRRRSMEFHEDQIAEEQAREAVAAEERQAGTPGKHTEVMA